MIPVVVKATRVRKVRSRAHLGVTATQREARNKHIKTRQKTNSAIVVADKSYLSKC
jgi:hypothetical protein